MADTKKRNAAEDPEATALEDSGNFIHVPPEPTRRDAHRSGYMLPWETLNDEQVDPSEAAPVKGTEEKKA
ncbi:hypothetical protein [Candidatus Cyanaurora vandensis]|uniref:hypothetical protein n=1 Tax=Candidatus Cyanaurora vandensis TaxID=2714958 RepID=UPI00257BE99B|nr:hypothetical protein [Candidatus Cyanaurora vandensis]